MKNYGKNYDLGPVYEGMVNLDQVENLLRELNFSDERLVLFCLNTDSAVDFFEELYVALSGIRSTTLREKLIPVWNQLIEDAEAGDLTLIFKRIKFILGPMYSGLLSIIQITAEFGASYSKSSTYVQIGKLKEEAVMKLHHLSSVFAHIKLTSGTAQATLQAQRGSEIPEWARQVSVQLGEERAMLEKVMENVRLVQASGLMIPGIVSISATADPYSVNWSVVSTYFQEWLQYPGRNVQRSGGSEAE